MEHVKVATRTGRNSHAALPNEKRTECGVRITPVPSGKPFDPEHELACVRCVRFMSERASKQR